MYVKIDLSDTDYKYLEACARIRRTSLRKMCNQLLHDIAHDRLVEAVLDDDGQPVQGKQYRTRRYELFQ
jgi:hypothetical protein